MKRRYLYKVLLAILKYLQISETDISLWLYKVFAIIALSFAAFERPLGRPPFRPLALAAANTAFVLSLIMSLSNSAKAANR